MDCTYLASDKSIHLDCSNSATWLAWAFSYAEIAAVIVVIVVLIVALLGSVHIASQWDRAVVLRLGKFSRVMGPGLFLTWPFLEHIAEWVSVQIEVTKVNAEKTLTKDTVPINVQAVLFWRVTDPRAAVVEVAEYQDSLESAALVALREIIGTVPLTLLLSEREIIDAKLRESIAKKTEGWGVEIRAVDIQDVLIPDELEDAMSREAQAERERHARVILGQSEIDIAKQLVEAAKIYEADEVALQLRAMNIIYETTKERGSTILLPSSIVDALSGTLIKKGGSS